MTDRKENKRHLIRSNLYVRAGPAGQSVAPRSTDASQTSPDQDTTDRIPTTSTKTSKSGAPQNELIRTLLQVLEENGFLFDPELHPRPSEWRADEKKETTSFPSSSDNSALFFSDQDQNLEPKEARKKPDESVMDRKMDSQPETEKKRKKGPKRKTRTTPASKSDASTRTEQPSSSKSATSPKKGTRKKRK